jgi:hypothetical protein
VHSPHGAPRAGCSVAPAVAIDSRMPAGALEAAGRSRLRAEPPAWGQNVLVLWNRNGLAALSLSRKYGATVSDQTNEYRENAAECSRMADITVDVRDKQTWAELAAYWLRLLRPIGQVRPVSLSLPLTPFPAGQLPVQPPVCLACQKPMKYLRTYPNIKNPSLDEHFYRCVCGEKQSILEPR